MSEPCEEPEFSEVSMPEEKETGEEIDDFNEDQSSDNIVWNWRSRWLYDYDYKGSSYVIPYPGS